MHLYDLTSTYFDCAVPPDAINPRRFVYSRDKRGDSVRVVVALVVTPEGMTLAYEMFPGKTADKTTLRGMLATIPRRYGAPERIWVMDRGIPTEEILTELCTADVAVRYLVGTPKDKLTRYEAALTERPRQEVRVRLWVKLLPAEGGVYVLAESQARAGKERGMRRRKLKAYWKRLGERARQAPPRDQLLEKLGAAKDRAGRIAKNRVVIAVITLRQQLARLAPGLMPRVVLRNSPLCNYSTSPSPPPTAANCSSCASPNPAKTSPSFSPASLSRYPATSTQNPEPTLSFVVATYGLAPPIINPFHRSLRPVAEVGLGARDQAHAA